MLQKLLLVLFTIQAIWDARQEVDMFDCNRCMPALVNMALGQSSDSHLFFSKLLKHDYFLCLSNWFGFMLWQQGVTWLASESA